MIRLPGAPLPPLFEASGAALERALARAPQAEWGLAHQGARVLLTPDQAAGWLVRRAGRRLVAMGLPLGPAALPELARAAAARGLTPLLYKCDAATAAAARRQGWRVLRLGHEAILDLATWTPDRPPCRQLRRKLRSPGAAGLRLEEATDLPLARMTVLSRDWEARRGGERGFSMGRLDRRLLRRQRVMLAWDGEALAAFATFHATRLEWALDLMRLADGAPDGTMQRLLLEAATRARVAGAERLSLAAIPDPAVPRLLVRPDAGLGQFKRAFGPRLSPRFAAAPGRLSLMGGLLRVAWAIHRPGPLPEESAPDDRLLADPVGVGRERKFAFEPAAIPCDARPAPPPGAAAPPGWRPRP